VSRWTYCKRNNASKMRLVKICSNAVPPPFLLSPAPTIFRPFPPRSHVLESQRQPTLAYGACDEPLLIGIRAAPTVTVETSLLPADGGT